MPIPKKNEVDVEFFIVNEDERFYGFIKNFKEYAI